MPPQIIFAHAGITFIKPSAALARVVSGYSLFDFRRRAQLPLAPVNFPSGSIELWLNFGARPRLENRDELLPTASLLGVSSQADRYAFAPHTHSLHIEFRPAGAAMLLRQPVHELAGQIVSLDQLLPAWIVRAVEATSDLPPLRQIDAIEALLLGQIVRPAQPVTRVEAAAALLRQHWDRVSIRELAAALNISQSQLERSFAAELGTTPKQFARTMRFLGTLLHLNQQSDQTLAWFAAEHGYVDQAHFAHEFKAFTGQTPTAFLRSSKDAAFLQDRWPAYA
jgi:AraC-like DNA-binding protein